jgi:hypothetical protein
MAQVATTVLSSITSIGEIVVINLGAKGLHLHEGSRTRSFVGKSIAIVLKEEPSQLKTMYQKFWQHSSQKSENLRL